MFNVLKILDIRKQESVPYYKKIIVNKNWVSTDTGYSTRQQCSYYNCVQKSKNSFLIKVWYNELTISWEKKRVKSKFKVEKYYWNEKFCRETQ